MTTTKEQQCVAIVGSGHAGIQAAESLRLGGFTGRVVLVDSESQYPYQRPPLSKGYLAGNEGSATPLRAESFFSSRDIDYRPDTSALAIDRSRRDLALSDGTSVSWTEPSWRPERPHVVSPSPDRTSRAFTSSVRPMTPPTFARRSGPHDAQSSWRRLHRAGVRGRCRPHGY